MATNSFVHGAEGPAGGETVRGPRSDVHVWAEWGGSPDSVTLSGPFVEGSNGTTASAP